MINNVLQGVRNVEQLLDEFVSSGLAVEQHLERRLILSCALGEVSKSVYQRACLVMSLIIEASNLWARSQPSGELLHGGSVQRISHD
jgi:hypothetical protein